MQVVNCTLRTTPPLCVVVTTQPIYTAPICNNGRALLQLLPAPHVLPRNNVTFR